MTESAPITIEPPQCDFVAFPFKNKRKGFWWRCKACSFMAIALKQPPCTCKTIVIPKATRETISD